MTRQAICSVLGWWRCLSRCILNAVVAFSFWPKIYQGIRHADLNDQTRFIGWKVALPGQGPWELSRGVRAMQASACVIGHNHHIEPLEDETFQPHLLIEAFLCKFGVLRVLGS
jgi:hypothetical protein